MAEESRKAIKLGELNKFLSEGNINCLEGLSVEGDIEIEVEGGGADLGPVLAAGFGQEITKMATQLLNFSKAMGYSAESLLVQPKK